MRVLLVEDDLTTARGVQLMLKSSGAVVDHAETGDEALDLSDLLVEKIHLADTAVHCLSLLEREIELGQPAAAFDAEQV